MLLFFSGGYPLNIIILYVGKDLVPKPANEVEELEGAGAIGQWRFPQSDPSD